MGDYFSISEIALMLNLSNNHVRSLCRREILHAYKNHKGDQWLIPKTVENLLYLLERLTNLNLK